MAPLANQFTLSLAHAAPADVRLHHGDLSGEIGALLWIRVRTCGLKGVMGAWSDPGQIRVV